jgi:hypothetical protein
MFDPEQCCGQAFISLSLIGIRRHHLRKCSSHDGDPTAIPFVVMHDDCILEWFPEAVAWFWQIHASPIEKTGSFDYLL